MSKLTVALVAKILNKDPYWVRAGIINGYLPIGIATRHGRQITSIKDMDSRFGRITYTIIPNKFYEFMGTAATEESRKITIGMIDEMMKKDGDYYVSEAYRA